MSGARAGGSSGGGAVSPSGCVARGEEGRDDLRRQRGPELLSAAGGASSGGSRAVWAGPAWALGRDVAVLAPGLPGQAAGGGGAGVRRGRGGLP